MGGLIKYPVYAMIVTELIALTLLAGVVVFPVILNISGIMGAMPKPAKE